VTPVSQKHIRPAVRRNGTRQRRLVFDAVVLGVVGALSARVFMWLLHWSERIFLQGIGGYSPPGVPIEGGNTSQVIGPHGMWLVLVAIVLAGLISGVLVYALAPEAEGHGTDTAVRAYHFNRGNIRARVPPLKAIASAITIGAGGAAGREGPIALVAAGVGSVYARLEGRPDEDRRLLTLVGMSAGLSAIFRSPVGAAVFAVEVLYGNMEVQAPALLLTLLSAIVAYAVNGLFVGYGPLFRVPTIETTTFVQYSFYALLGVASGVMAAIVPMVFYRVRDLFKMIPGPDHIKPVIGALGVGIMAFWLPQVLGGGYGWIQHAINGDLPLKLLIILAFAKLIAFSLTVSSGGSGGVFAPTLFVGAMLGGALAHVFHVQAAAFVVVGMAAVFGGAARVPLATLLMVTEMTDGYGLLVPAALAVSLSFLVQLFLTGKATYPSLYEGQVPGRVDSSAHQAELVQFALRLLQRQQVPCKATLDHLDLVALLAAGIALELPGDKVLAMARLEAGSPYLGREACHEAFADLDPDVETAVLIRDEEVLPLHGETRFAIGDCVLVVTPELAWKRIAAGEGRLVLVA